MSKFKKFDDEIDFAHAKININTNNQQNFPVQSIDFSVDNQQNPSNDQKPNSSIEFSTNVINNININLSFIGKYFNVEIDDIQRKIVHSLIPFKKGFYELAENSPDLYGPFWICTTLIFIVVISSNISAFLNVILNLIKFKFDF